MFRLFCLFLLFRLCLPATSFAQVSRDTFTPGQEVIFIDSLIAETSGEFPRKWDQFRGAAENAVFEGQPVITSTTTITTIFPLMDREEYLPEDGWTLEFDAYFPHKVGHYQMSWNKRKARRPVRVLSDRLTFNKQRFNLNGGVKLGWRHVAVSYVKGNLKVWIDGERLINVPRLGIELKNFEIQIYASQANLDAGLRPAMTNIRLAKAELPLYERLVTTGKLIFSDITFETGKATITPQSLVIIDRIATLLTDHPELKVSIEGHTDQVGQSEANQALSEARALAVKTALTEKRITAKRLQTKGYGETKPIADNETEAGRALNRRVEIVRAQ